MKVFLPIRCKHIGPDRRCGFTIVEVLVAMTVTGIGLVSVFGALRIANDVTDRIRNEEAAQLLAERQMVRLLACPSGQAVGGEGDEGKFTWESRVEPSCVSNVAEVVVCVRWLHRGRPFSFELVSMREKDKGSG